MKFYHCYFPFSVDFVINEMRLFETVLFFKNPIYSCVNSHVTEHDVKSMTTLLQDSTLSEMIAKKINKITRNDTIQPASNLMPL